jgi:hypothetical protein
MIIEKIKQYFSKKENKIYTLLFLLGFCVAFYGYGLKGALLVTLFTVSTIVIGLFLSDLYFFLKLSGEKYDKRRVIRLITFLLIVVLDYFFLKLLIILYIIFLGSIIAFLGTYRGLKLRKNEDRL